MRGPALLRRRPAATAIALVALSVWGRLTHAQIELARTVVADEAAVRLDMRPVVLSLDIPEDSALEPEQAELASRLFPTYRDAMRAASDAGVMPLPSIQVVAGKGKQIDDGMYAALELALEQPLGEIPLGKPALLERLAQALESRMSPATGLERTGCEAALVYVGAALELGAHEMALTDDLAREARGAARDFRKDTLRSKPIGFYTWSEALSKVFIRDRYLQKMLGLDDTGNTAGAVVLTDAVTADPELDRGFRQARRLYERVTNPAAALTLDDYSSALQEFGGAEKALTSEEALASFADLVRQTAHAQQLLARGTHIDVRAGDLGLALLPHSNAKESDLLREMPFEGEDSMDSVVEAIRAGRISLKPDVHSGWYEHQQYALEPLLLPDRMPSARKLQIGDEYRKHLEEAFKTMLTKARETHIKQLLPAAGEAPAVEVELPPLLACEPLPEVYLRIARAYGFLIEQLDDIVGAEALAGLSRLREDEEPSSTDLRTELEQTRDLYYGVYFVTCRDIGLEPSVGADQVAPSQQPVLMTEAETWLSKWEQDEDLAKDVRVIIPVHDWPDRPPVYWATLGVALVPLHVHYETPPEAVGEVAEVAFTGAELWLPCDVFAAFARWGDPPTREEFRRLCDRQRSAEGILAALGAEGVSPLAARGVGGRWGLVIVSMVVVVLLVSLLFRKRRTGAGRS